VNREGGGILSRIFHRLWPGPLGKEARADLEEAYRRRQFATGSAPAWIWYTSHLLHPDTWRLALRLWRGEAQRSDGVTGMVWPGRNRMGAPCSWLDFKLAYRMLTKYPGLTFTSGLAIAFAVALTTSSFEFFTDVFYPTLPVDQSHELVEIRSRDVRTMRFETRILDDFEVWRRQLRSVVEVGAFQEFRRTLRTQGGAARTLLGASMTGAAFQTAGVPPLLGRGLTASDEAPGAPRVLVIGYDVWQTVFAGDVDVVGRTVRLESEPATVVGVMPEGHRFPRHHDAWEPLRYTSRDFEPGEGPGIRVIARLAPGSSLREAQAELTVVGLRMAADNPETHGTVKPEVVRYGRLPLPVPDAVTAGIYWACVLFFVMLLMLVYGNVALLLFARTVSRESEMMVRTALGASRGRIVAQLAAEALVLAGVASAVGLAASQAGLGLLVEVVRKLEMPGMMAYWVGDRLSPSTIAGTLVLTLSGAIACGVVPALKVTARERRLSGQTQSVAGSGPEAGRLWGGIIVTQIAATAAFVPLLIVMGIEMRAFRDAEFGFPAAEYLSVRLRTDQSPIPGLSLAESRAEHTARYVASVRELEQRLEADPGVMDVTAASQIPGEYHDWGRIVVDGAISPAVSSSGERVQTVAVDTDFFDALRIPIVSGRGFERSDAASDRDVVVVNEDFVRVVLGGRSPVGRQLQYMDPRSPDVEGPAYEIVGVAKQITMTLDPDRPLAPGVYHVLRREAGWPLHLILRTGRPAAAFAPRLHTLATEVAPTLQLLDVRRLDEAGWHRVLARTAMFWVMLVAGGLAVLLSTSSIYAIVSSRVSRRVREIGIRVALGARRHQVVSTVLSRTTRQIAIGVVLGGVISLVLLYSMLVGSVLRPALTGTYAGIFSGYLIAMACVCLLATLVPTMRALRIEPTEALKAEG
jgi:putative ABC transport system permease protein